MTFLSNLFRPVPRPDEWPLIAADISKGLQDVKKSWFYECVVAVDLGLFADKQRSVDPRSPLDKQVDAKVVNTDLGGSAALAITGYQICCAGSVITTNGYLSKDKANTFLNLLCERVSGVEATELLKYIRRYDATNNDAATQRFKLGVDVARYVTNQEPSMLLSLHVASLAEKLFTTTCVVVANSFGDSARVHTLSRQIALSGKQLRPRC